LQGPGEKFIEAGVTLRVRLRRLGHIHVKMPDKPLNHPVFQPGGVAQVCQSAGAAGQQVLGYDMLEKDEDSIHGRQCIAYRVKGK